MKKSLLITLLSITSIVMSSCNYHGSSAKINNGDLILYENYNAQNLYQKMTLSRLEMLISTNEPYTFYLTNAECSHCYYFAPVIGAYVEKSKQLIYRLDLEDDRAEFEAIYEKYQDLFFINSEVLTPSVFIASGEQFSTSLPFQKFENETMFTNLMKERYYETNVYNITKMDALNKWIETSTSITAFFFDRSKTSNTIYDQQVKDILLKSKNNSLVIDTSFFDEEDKQEFCEVFDTTTTYVPFAYHFENGKTVSKYTFTSDVSKGIEYLNKYL